MINDKTASDKSNSATPFTQIRDLPLRTKLLIGNLLILLGAVGILGYYLFNRTQTTNELLTRELDQSVALEIQNRFDAALSEGAANLDAFFLNMEKNVETIGGAVSSMLAQESSPTSALFWDANQALRRLPNGSWDNEDDEPGSIFIPAKLDLTVSLATEINALKQMDYLAPIILQENPDVIAVYFGGITGETLYYPNVNLANILPPDFDVTQRPWFLVATPDQNLDRDTVWSVPYQDAALNGLVITSSTPIYDDDNRFRGVVAVDILLNRVTDLVAGVRVGNTGYSFLIDKNARVISLPKAQYEEFNIPIDLPDEQLPNYQLLDKVDLNLFEVLVKMTQGQRGSRTVELGNVEYFVAYEPIPSLGYSLGTLTPAEEMRQPFIVSTEKVASQTRTTRTGVFIILGIVLTGATIASLWFGNLLSRPLEQLTRSASELAVGNFQAKAQVHSEDEIGILAKTFNNIAETLQGLIGSLEKRVAERTADLEKRANQLHAVSDVARTIASIQELELLLPNIAKFISERFGFYHIGIFLLDEQGKNAVFAATNSEGGQKMLERKHQLAVLPKSIVGYAAYHQTPRIALDTGEDSVFFNNPDLPDTRSELALPLKVGRRLIGVLDVQSVEKDAFLPEDIAVLTTLADQVAIAIENARLFAETHQALIKAEETYHTYFEHAWNKFTKQQKLPRYRYEQGKTVLVERPPIQENKVNGKLSIPVQIGKQTVGMLEIQAQDPERKWTSEELALVKAIAERAAPALENARLLIESQKREARGYVIGEISSSISVATDMETIMRKTVQALGHSLGAAEVVLELIDADKE